MPGEIDEQSQAIGQLQAGLESLRQAHAEKSREDEEFRKAGYKAFAALEAVAKTQADHEVRLADHEVRLAAHDQRASRQKGFIAAVTIMWGLVSAGITWAVSYVSSPSQ